MLNPNSKPCQNQTLNQSTMSQLFSFREEITNVLEDDDAEVAGNVLDMTEAQLQQGTV